MALALMDLSAFAIFLSSTTQSSLGPGVGVMVLVLLLWPASSLGLADPLHPYFLTNQFEA